MGIAKLTASCVLMCVSIDCVLLSVVMFDPACFYGHHEYDLAIAGMFGGFTRQFYDEYHSIIPKAAGFELRHKLYLLFHYLNHWYGIIRFPLLIIICHSPQEPFWLIIPLSNY